MKNIFLCLAMFLSFSIAVNAQTLQGNDVMKIKLTIDDKIIVVKMEDNSAVRQLRGMLPFEFEFIDFAGKEKISEFPKPVALKDTPRGMIASQGKMFIYVPWGNFGFFYKNHGSSVDKSLIQLGEVESGLEYLQNQRGGFKAKIENME